jgi:hypothetical protein
MERKWGELEGRDKGNEMSEIGCSESEWKGKGAVGEDCRVVERERESAGNELDWARVGGRG